MITILAGGTGAAKFIRGLVECVPQEEITIIGNTGDDVIVWGLHVSPDLDTIMYLLTGLLDEERGWGIRDDSFACLQAMQQFDEITWFQLGDRDLATHIERTCLLRQGLTLSEVTSRLCQALGVKARILPMSEERVETRIHTPNGILSFQEFFVRDRWAANVTAVDYHGSEQAHPAPGVLEAIYATDAIIIAPSNPITSIGPILAVNGIRQALFETLVPVVAISPIVGGRAVSGPAGKLMAAFDYDVSAIGVARMYRDFLDALVIDEQDADLTPTIERLGARVVCANTIMQTLSDKVSLARTVLACLNELDSARTHP
ncbi:MAG: 2-phospho-L-lactate transferase [Acidobacteriota bacterium]|nr:2-phospho-L-lactate transferase [Blastocatellia bacterium]MDW8239276.1 2-phospho-L-lactate transferase [Acidobacteriota bacterium]